MTQYMLPILAAGLNPNQLLMTDIDKKIISLDYDDTQLGIDSSGLYVKPEGINHDLLLNFVANEHINHSGVSISPGTGMSGGGDLTATRTLTCTITQYTDSLARTACIASSISDGDLTHSPDGNSVFDALALKSPIASPTFTGIVTMPASVVISDGGTIGQAAGPLIAFDDTLNYLEITGCNVGIGTTTPTSGLTFGTTKSTISLDTADGLDTGLLQISGGGEVGVTRGAYFNLLGNEYVTIGGSLQIFAGNVATGKIGFYTASSVERMVISNAGYVGIGTETPLTALDVFSGDGNLAIRSTGTAALGAISGGMFHGVTNLTPTGADQRLGGIIFAGISTGTTYQYSARMAAFSGEAWSATAAGSYLTFSTVDNTTLVLDERVRITHDGNVGIGTEMPRKLLEISDASPQIYLNETDQSANNKLWGIGLSASNFYIIPRDDTEIAQSYPFIISKAGNVGMGTVTPTAQNGLSPVLNIAGLAGSEIVIQGTGVGSSPSLGLVFKTGAAVNQVWLIGSNILNQLGDIEFYDKTHTADRMVITNAGNVGIGTAVTFGANAVGVLAIKNGTVPAAAVADTIQIFSVDSSDAKATLGLMLEQAVEAIGTFTASNKIKVKINGTEYWIQLDAV